MSATDNEPRTPLRPRSGQQPADSGAREESNASSAASATDPDKDSPKTAAFKTHMELMQQQMTLLTNRLTAPPPAAMVDTSRSREYWSHRIDESVMYPGENASSTAKRAYKQRLDAHLRKSAPIWSLVTRKDPAPLSANAQATALLKSVLGNDWIFDSQEMQTSLDIVLRHDSALHAIIIDEMEAGADTPAGSWSQRNSALYSTIGDTLDLSKGGSDLSIIDVVEPCNGIALYDLVSTRLAEVQSTDPLARAMQIRMNLQHIKYKIIPHGVAFYFAQIKDHRAELLALPKPKMIADWEVVTKALRELPPIHEKFADAASVLAIQRKITKQETSLPACRAAFIGAELDNNVYLDLKNKPSHKRKLKANLAKQRKRTRIERDNANKGEFPKGSCAHHPNSTTHLTSQCSNPFGYGSVFGKAVDHVDKCKAVRASIAAGWSKEATWVKIPSGYGVAVSQPDAAVTQPHVPAVLPPTTVPRPPPAHPFANLQTNTATTSRTAGAPISLSDLEVYHRVRATMESSFRSARPRPPPPTAMQFNAPPAPLHAFHTSTGYSRYRPHFGGWHPAYSARPPNTPSPHSTPRPPHAAQRGIPVHAVPQPFQSYMTGVNPNNGIPAPTNDDIISAGMRYYANQAGGQHFC